MGAGIRNATSTAISVAVTAYILNALRVLLLESWYMGTIISYLVLWILILLAGSLIWLFTHIGKTQRKMTQTSKRLLFWALIFFTGHMAYVQFPVIFDLVTNFVFRDTQGFIYSPAVFIAMNRLMPFEHMGLYSVAIYAALSIMLFTGLISTVLNGGSGTGVPGVISSVKTPLILIIIAVILASVVSNIQYAQYIMWGVFYILAIFGMHKAFAQAMGHFNFVPSTKKRGLKLYKAIADITETRYESTVDKVAVFFTAGLALLAQAALLAVFVIYIINYIVGNFSGIQEVMTQWVLS